MVHSVYYMECNCCRLQINSLHDRASFEQPTEFSVRISVGMGPTLSHCLTHPSHYYYTCLYEWVGFLDAGQLSEEKIGTGALRIRIWESIAFNMIYCIFTLTVNYC